LEHDDARFDHAGRSVVSSTVEWFDRFANFAVTPAFTWWSCGVIVAFGIGAALVFTLRARRARGRIQAASDVLAPLTSPQDLAREFERIGQQFEADDVFRHPWQEFRESLVVPDDAGPVEGTIPSSLIFNEESLLEGLNVRFYNAVPSYLTGAGILGTFLGLVAGLWVARDGLRANEVELMRESLGGLLAGGSLAFWTSICGLITSICFSWWEKDRLHRFQRRIGNFCRKLDSLVVRLSSEVLAKRTLREAEKQTSMLNRFNTDLALQIASALDERMAQRLGPQIERLVTTMEGVRADRGDSLKENLTQMVDGMVARFEAAFQGAAGGEMRGLASTIEGVSADLKIAASSLAGQQGGLVAGLADFQSRLDSLLTDLATRLEQERGQSDATLQRQLGEIGNRVAQVSQGLADAASAMGNTSRSAPGRRTRPGCPSAGSSP
jgi:hypothetical protein